MTSLLLWSRSGARFTMSSFGIGAGRELIRALARRRNLASSRMIPALIKRQSLPILKAGIFLFFEQSVDRALIAVEKLGEGMNCHDLVLRCGGFHRIFLHLQCPEWFSLAHFLIVRLYRAIRGKGLREKPGSLISVCTWARGGAGIGFPRLKLELHCNWSGEAQPPQGVKRTRNWLDQKASPVRPSKPPMALSDWNGSD